MLEGITQLALSIAYFKKTTGERTNNIESAIKYSISASKLSFTNPILYSFVQKHLGHIYSKRVKGKYEENIEQAIKHFNNALDIVIKDRFPIKWAEIKIELGAIYLYSRTAGDKSNNIEMSIAHYVSALEIYNKPSYPLEWASAMYGLGTAYIANVTGNTKKNIYIAISYLNSGLKIYTEIDFPYNWALTQKQLGLAYSKLANFSILTESQEESDLSKKISKNTALAATHLENALRVFLQEKYPFHWGKIHYSLGKLYLNICSLNDEMVFNENIKQAIANFTNALKVFNKKNNFSSWVEIKAHLADAYLEGNLGNKEKNTKQAIELYNQILHVLYNKQRNGESFSRAIAIFQNKLATVYIEKYTNNKERNIERAIGLLTANLIAIDKNNFPAIWSETQYKLGKAYEARIVGDNYQNKITAISHYQSASITESSANYYDLAHDLGKLAYGLKDWNLSIDAYSKCLREFNEMRDMVHDSELKEEMCSEANITQVYQNIVMACINLGKFDKAIEYIEQSKAKQLVDLLSYRNIYPKGNISKEVIEQLDYLRDRIIKEQYDLQQQDLSSRATNNVSNLRKALDDLVTKRIKPVDPSFKLAQKVEPISFEEIKESLPNEKTVLIEWCLSDDDTLFAFLVASQKDRPLLISYSKKECKSLYKLFNQYLNTYLDDYSNWNLKLNDLLAEIAVHLKLTTIIDRATKLVPDCDRLILVPHRWLHLLPIHALPIINNKCLLDLFSQGVSFAPSVQLLKLSSKQSKPEFKSLFAIQNPTNDLNFTNIEVQAIRTQFQPNDDVLEKDRATKSALTQEKLAKIHIAHFSCHGYFNFENPELSALLMAGSKVDEEKGEDKENKRERGEKIRFLPSRNGGNIDLEKCLTLGEIFGLDLRNCRLVTLSACETGLTDFKSLSDEYIGLPSGFLYAGSPSVVSSLWAVSDLSTTFLMIKFYQNLQEIDSVAISLNQAQLWLRSLTRDEFRKWSKDIPLTGEQRFEIDRRFRENDYPFASPYHWGAFCAVGS